MPYAYGSEQDGPSQFGGQFAGPITELYLSLRLEQGLRNEEATSKQLVISAFSTQTIFHAS